MEFLIRFQAYCNMVSVDQAWTLIARFSNIDAGWMTLEAGGMTVFSLQEKPLTLHTTQT